MTARAWGYPLRGQQDPRYTHQSAKAGPCQKKCYYLVPNRAEKKKRPRVERTGTGNDGKASLVGCGAKGWVASDGEAASAKEE